jgi:hypothetical protein
MSASHLGRRREGAANSPSPLPSVFVETLCCVSIKEPRIAAAFPLQAERFPGEGRRA